MARLEFTAHLTTLFPQLQDQPLEVERSTVKDIVDALEQLAPGIAFYLCDERGRLRRHVNIFVDGEMMIDRKTLSDELNSTSRVFIAQALSGG